MERITGIISSLTTNFNIYGEVDYNSLINNINFQKKAGIKNICILGGTGEATSLSKTERQKIIELTMENADGLKVVCGTLTGNPEDIKDDIKKAKECGVHACMVMPPTFVMPSQSEIVELMKMYVQSDVPIILFNTPSRAGVSISLESISKLSRIPNIIGIKEASGDINFLQDLKLKCEKDFVILAGGDIEYLPSLALGAEGGLLAVAAVLPELLLQIEKTFKEGDVEKSKKFHYKLKELSDVIYKISHPLPLKWALKHRGLSNGIFRTPFQDITADHKKQIEEQIDGIIFELSDEISFLDNVC